MKTSEIKQILAKDPNAVFRIGGRGRYTHFGSIKAIEEKVVDTYNDWGRKSGTRVDVKLTVHYESFSKGWQSEYGYAERLPAVTLEQRSWLKPRDIECHIPNFGQTIEEHVAQRDAEVKADWQAKKDEQSAKQRQVNQLIKHLGVFAEDEKRWDTLSDDLITLRTETIQLINELIASRV